MQTFQVSCTQDKSTTRRLGRGGGLTESRATRTDAADQSSGRTVRQQIMVLETQARKLREALNYLENPKEEESLQALTHVWLVGGREVVERLFAIIPEPDKPGATENQVHPTYFNSSWNGYITSDSILTEEERKFLANAPTDDNRDPVDYDGNPLLPEPMSNTELQYLIGDQDAVEYSSGREMDYRPTTFTR